MIRELKYLFLVFRLKISELFFDLKLRVLRVLRTVKYSVNFYKLEIKVWDFLYKSKSQIYLFFQNIYYAVRLFYIKKTFSLKKYLKNNR